MKHQREANQAASVKLPHEDNLIWRFGFKEADAIVHRLIAHDMETIKPTLHFWPRPHKRRVVAHIDALPTLVDEAHPCRQETQFDAELARREDPNATKPLALVEV